MEFNELENKVKVWFSKGAKASKEAFEKAGGKVQDFTDRSVLKVEKKQLETKRETYFSELGKKLYELFVNNSIELTINNEEEKKALLKIKKDIELVNEQIEEKDKEINS